MIRSRKLTPHQVWLLQMIESGDMKARIYKDNMGEGHCRPRHVDILFLHHHRFLEHGEVCRPMRGHWLVLTEKSKQMLLDRGIVKCSTKGSISLS